jgi:hypothetical protein
MTDLSNLSWRQRIHRRVSLLGGSCQLTSALVELAAELLDDLTQTGRVLLDDLSNFL